MISWHRFYDPTTGRYITADPIGLAGGMNLYAYVGGDPVNLSDFEGLAADGMQYGPFDANNCRWEKDTYAGDIIDTKRIVDYPGKTKAQIDKIAYKLKCLALRRLGIKCPPRPFFYHERTRLKIIYQQMERFFRVCYDECREKVISKTPLGPAEATGDTEYSWELLSEELRILF